MPVGGLGEIPPDGPLGADVPRLSPLGRRVVLSASAAPSCGAWANAAGAARKAKAVSDAPNAASLKSCMASDM